VECLCLTARRERSEYHALSNLVARIASRTCYHEQLKGFEYFEDSDKPGADWKMSGFHAEVSVACRAILETRHPQDTVTK
jgi:hypothetical protein